MHSDCNMFGCGHCNVSKHMKWSHLFNSIHVSNHLLAVLDFEITSEIAKEITDIFNPKMSGSKTYKSVIFCVCISFIIITEVSEVFVLCISTYFTAMKE